MKRFKKILYIINPEEKQTPNSLVRAINLADSNIATLTVMSVVPDFSSIKIEPETLDKEAVFDKLRATIEGKLEIIKQSLNKNMAIDYRICEGKLTVEVVRAVLKNGHDLVIKEAENPSWIERLFGGDDIHLLRKCPCPVWLSKPDDKGNYKTIMAAVDFDSDENPSSCALNDTIINLSSSLSLSDFASLHLITVYDSLEAGALSLWSSEPEQLKRNLELAEYKRKKQAMDQLLDGMRAKLDQKDYDYIAPITHLIQGSPAQQLPKMAKQLKADLVVMGTLGRAGIRGIVIGNTAESLLLELDCSVLAIKPEGFISPITF